MKFKRIICMGMVAALTCFNLPQVTVCAQQIQEETEKDRGETQGQEDNPLDLQNLGLETEDAEEANPNQAMSEEGHWYGNFQYKEMEDGTLAITDYKEDDVKEITIPNEIEGKKVTIISVFAFSDCSSLNSISIQKGVKSIGAYAFEGCSSLNSINIPAGVTSIGPSAFRYCSSLSSISIPKEVTSISNLYVFSGCSSLKEIIVDENNKTYASQNGILYKDKTTLFCCPAGKTGKVDIPKGVTSIGYFAFSGCSGLSDVTIPNSVTDIGSHAFYGCSGLKSVTIPNTVTSIGGNAIGYFNSANGAKTEKIPNFTIYGTNGSEAERYAKDNGFTFRSSGGDSSQGDKITCKKTVYKVAYGTKPFKINASSKSKMAFTSSNPKVAAVDKNTGKVTIKNTGIANITIKAGKTSKKVTIKVSPKKPSVKSTAAVKGKKLTVRWAKDKMASGYQVQVSTDKKFKKGVKSKNLSKISYTFTKLKTGKKYYVRVRSYKKSGKETLYSSWSKTKSGSRIKR